MRKGTSPLVEQLFDVLNTSVCLVDFKLHMAMYRQKGVFERDCNACLGP